MAKKKRKGKFDDTGLDISKSTKNEFVVTEAMDSLTRDIETVVQEAVVSGQLGSESYVREKKIIIAKRIVEAKAVIEPATIGLISESYTEAANATRSRLAYYGYDVSGGFKATDRQLLKTIADQTVSRLDEGLNVMAKRSSDILSQGALEAISQVDITDASNAEKFARILDRAGVTSAGRSAGRPGVRLIRLNGRNYDAQKYSQMVLRTEKAKTFSQATINQMIELEADVVGVTDTGDDDPACAQWMGRLFSLTGATPGYEILPPEAIPPYHPNCVHVLYPADPDF